MRVEIFLAALVLAVVILVAADFFRTASDGPHELAGEPAHDAGPGTFGEPRAMGKAFLPSAGGAGHAFDAGLAGSPARISSPAGARPHLSAGPAAPAGGSRGARKSWLVRTRLSLLAIVPAFAAVLATVGVVRAADAFQRTSFRSALVACVVSVVVLAVGVASAIRLIRSVLQPLRKLQAGAAELAEVRLPDALRRITRCGGEGLPPDVGAMATSSSDEIGEVARAFDQIQGEVLRLAANEAGLRGKLNEMFVDLSCRGQSLMERQIRLIDELEQGEQDTERLASLFKMDHIATRMRRYSQNLLVLAGRELPGRWNEPVTLANVIRAAVSEIEEYERVSFGTQPGIAVSGPAVNDVVHLIAELAENATSLSAGDKPVDISARTLANGGVLVEVADQGVGMNPDDMAQANWWLENPSATDVTVYKNMGLFVVGRLAARHGIKVRLQPAQAGGLTALVWLPDAIVILQPAEREASAGPPRPAPALEGSKARQRPAPAPVPDAGHGPEADSADERRLPIYEAVESDWFGNRRKPFGGTAAAEDSWASPVDNGWQAAQAVIAPASSGLTTAGLPVRAPRANLVPGAVGGPQPAGPARSAAAARDRLGRLQRGASEGRAVASAAANPGDE